MTTKHKAEEVPAPRLTYQGSGLSVVRVELDIGPFAFPAYPGLALGHAVAFSEVEGIPQVALRPHRVQTPLDPSTEHFTMGFEQAGTEWDMIFRITTDPAGGMVGTSFALDVQSNYPQIPMSLAKQVVVQPSYGALVRNDLPADYRAQMTVSYWHNGRKEPPIDAWMMLEVAYVRPAARGKSFPTPEAIPMVPVSQAVLYPAHCDTKGGVLGNNYPSQVLRRRATP